MQDVASNQIYNYVSNNQSCICLAVCGAGKTELVYKSIEYFINQGLKVGFAIPRKDVVKEIYLRLKNDFNNIVISQVYGGNDSFLNAQIVCLTTHQLYRFENYFSLLILDEADAFPYYKNEFLESFLYRSCKGPIIYLSATLNNDYLKICRNIVYVNRRFHNFDLPVPIFIKYNNFNKINILKKVIDSLKNKPILIFVPTIEIGKELSKAIKYNFVYSSFKDKDKYIQQFKENKGILITTSILERGVTFFDVQVIVYEANHKLFNKATLIQISGRVGRKLKAPTGKVYFLSNNLSIEMKECIEEIKNKNNN